MRRIILIFTILTLPIFVLAGAELPAWEDTSCDFNKSDTKLGPLELVKAFIDKGGNGKFLSEEANWYHRVLACSGHVAAGEITGVVSDFKIIDKKIADKSAEISVEYSIVGYLSSKDGERNYFENANEKDTVKYELVKTPYGWRISNYPWQRPKIFRKAAWKAAVYHGWAEGDLEKFKKVVGAKK